MYVNQPDNWILFYSEEYKIVKVVAGWSGGYLNGDSWRINSGVVRVDDDGNYYLFHGSSGSVYKCHKKANVVRMNIGSIVSQLEENDAARIIEVDEALELIDAPDYYYRDDVKKCKGLN
jgi:hypothetical protein